MLRGSQGREQILRNQICSCHTKRGAETCTQPETVLAISVRPSLCRPHRGTPRPASVLPRGGLWGAQPHEAAHTSGLRERGAGPPHRLSRRHPQPEKPPGQEGIARAAVPHSPWRCRPAMHRLPRRSPCPSLHLGLKYL